MQFEFSTESNSDSVFYIAAGSKHLCFNECFTRIKAFETEM